MLIEEMVKKTPDGGRPICIYPNGYGNTIAYYHGNGYSGGYNGSWMARIHNNMD